MDKNNSSKGLYAGDADSLHTKANQAKVGNAFVTPGIPNTIATMADTTDPKLKSGTEKLRNALDQSSNGSNI